MLVGRQSRHKTVESNRGVQDTRHTEVCDDGRCVEVSQHAISQKRSKKGWHGGSSAGSWPRMGSANCMSLVVWLSGVPGTGIDRARRPAVSARRREGGGGRARCSAALTGRQGVRSASRGGMFLFVFASGLPIRAA
ncbi:hypothetical protein VFPFJ_06128 [Purpureocillium lilacinum]|uniref:Uncharacterized protein n=1 Tax=Purpureocillium lilacinum TaxID=33203 RepID=A0A179HI54_PURLI|nr:hypothetical protein VFPFJ_06128 [Purpureocillium lilacinum]OAQ89714.1 hypothetical protein VFPFJ_06128 [Purpureocillium lilacinum]